MNFHPLLVSFHFQRCHNRESDESDVANLDSEMLGINNPVHPRTPAYRLVGINAATALLQPVANFYAPRKKHERKRNK